MSFDGFNVQGSGFRVQGSGFRGDGAAHKNREAPQNFDSASRRRHRKRSRGSFFALRSVSHKNWQENDALVLRISAFTHTSFIGLQERFLASLEMTIRESEVFQSPVTNHQSQAVPPTRLKSSQNVGYDFRTLSAPSMVRDALHFAETAARAMAMRWSFHEETAPPVR